MSTPAHTTPAAAPLPLDSHADQRRRYGNRLRAVASGLLLVLATPPLPLYALAWLALFPFFRALENARNRREGFNLGFLFGASWHLGTMYWIAWNSGTPMVVSILSMIGLAGLLSAWMGLVGMLHLLLLRGFGRRGHWLAPLLWMATDVVWQSGDWSFPWITLALTQAQNLEILQLASVVGSVGLTGFVALLNSALTVAGRRWWGPALAGSLLIATWGWGAVRDQAVHDEVGGRVLATAAIVQGNIDSDTKWELGPWHSLTVYESLTEAMVPEQVDVVVWPENGAPVYVRQDYRWRRHLQEFVDRIGVTVITGGRFADFSEDGRTPYNAAFQISPGDKGRFKIYKKVFLVPMGERVPFQWLFPILGSLNMGQAEFRPGPGIITWPLATADSVTVPVAPLICYEAIFPQAGKRSVELGAQLLVNMTNDGWFTGTGQQRQHLLLSRMRSVETGRSMIRSTNTGISAFISPSGRIGASLPENSRGVILQAVEPPVDTWYLNHGYRIRWLVLALSVLVLLLAAVAGADEVQRWRGRGR